jgi:TPP-dependent pyruvate/acetoin dehydrogenase alpha subunit
MAPLIDIYEQMLRIRRCEEKALEMHTARQIAGNLHPYIGQEAVAAGACACLRKDDYIVSTHRGHGHVLAKGGTMKQLVAELLGKGTGYNKGKGGTLHVQDFGIGMLGTISLVGGGLPLGLGGGLAAKVKGSDQVTIVFFGDGAANQGTFHECLNMASLWKLPVIFICENNLYAMSVAVEVSTSVRDIGSRAAGYDMPGVVIDGNDAVAVYETVQAAVTRARKGEGPSLIECKTYRYKGHFTADHERYRSADEVKAWRKRDPIDRLQTLLRDAGALTDRKDKAIRDRVEKETEEAAAFALSSPPPSEEEALTDVFA